MTAEMMDVEPMPRFTLRECMPFALAATFGGCLVSAVVLWVGVTVLGLVMGGLTGFAEMGSGLVIVMLISLCVALAIAGPLSVLLGAPILYYCQHWAERQPRLFMATAITLGGAFGILAQIGVNHGLALDLIFVPAMIFGACVGGMHAYLLRRMQRA